MIPLTWEFLRAFAVNVLLVLLGMGIGAACLIYIAYLVIVVMNG